MQRTTTTEEKIQEAIKAVNDKVSDVRDYITEESELLGAKLGAANDYLYKEAHRVQDKAAGAKSEMKDELMKIAKELEHLIEEA